MKQLTINQIKTNFKTFLLKLVNEMDEEDYIIKDFRVNDDFGKFKFIIKNSYRNKGIEYHYDFEYYQTLIGFKHKLEMNYAFCLKGNYLKDSYHKYELMNVSEIEKLIAKITNQYCRKINFFLNDMTYCNFIDYLLEDILTRKILISDLENEIFGRIDNIKFEYNDNIYSNLGVDCKNDKFNK